MGQTNPYKIYSSCKWVWSPLVISWNKKWLLDKSYNHKSIIYWYVTVVICKLYPLISNSSSLKDLFFKSIRALSFASCGKLIIGDITSKDEGFSIHTLPHMFQNTSWCEPQSTRFETQQKYWNTCLRKLIFRFLIEILTQRL